MFNEGDYAGRLLRGELTVTLKEDNPAPPRAFLPAGTRSQIVIYKDVHTRKVVAIVHQYMRPDNTLGTSGKQDPKMINVDNVSYRPEPKPK